jgi:tetratricopeptide (TPR) repeat protein
MATVLVCLAVAYWFVPSNTELVQRLMLDQQYARYAEVLRGLGDPVRPSDLDDLKPEQVAVLTTLFRLTPREQLHLIFNQTSPPEYSRHVHAMALGAIRYVDVIRPDEAWALVQPHLHRIGSAQSAEIATTLAHNALALANPKLSATIWQRACESQHSTIEMAREMAQSFRWSAQPLQGARHLYAWLDRHHSSLSAKEVLALTKECGALALEGGSPGLALDTCLAEMKRLADGTAPARDQIERGYQFAIQSNRLRDVTPWMKRYLAALPEAKLDLPLLRQRCQSAPQEIADYRRLLLVVAQVADWDSHFDESFEQHLRLAAMGRIESLDRCLALTDFLGRSDETAELLTTIGEVKERPSLPLTRANMLASLGRDEEARPLFEQWLKAHPTDRDPAYAYASLLEDLGEEDAALAAFQDLLSHHPDDVPALKKLAENYIRDGRLADALKLYTTLGESDHDHYTLENYAMLAESQEDYEHLLAAQALIARHTRSADAYMEIAGTARDLEDKDVAIALLREGLDQMPDSAALRVALAEIYSLVEEPASAVEVLMHPSSRTHFGAVIALLNFSDDVTDKRGLLALLGDDVEKRFDMPPQSRLDLAVVCHQAGDEERAESLFASVPNTKHTLYALAEARFDTGAYDQSARLMQQYLQDQRRATSDDWVFLGDIYDLLGRTDDAKRAYNYSLTLLTSDLPDTAFREPSSAAGHATKP